jgi:tetratricopeptide (TPR) repeat protein
MSHDQSLSTVNHTARLVPILTAVVLVLLLVSRVVDLSDRLGQTGRNREALRSAFRSSESAPMASVASPPAAATVTGVEARAMAQQAMAAGQPLEAEAWLLAGMTDASSSFLTQFQLCRLYWELGAMTRALQACRGTVVSADYWLNAGYRALDAGSPHDALALFELAAYTDPQKAEAWRRYGHALLDDNRPEEAVVALERVLFLQPIPDADVYRALAEAYLRLDNVTMARDVLDEGLRNYPEQRDFYQTMAESFVAEDDTQTADSWYVRLLQRWPFESGVWAARGRLALDDGRVSDAVDYFQQAAANRPDGFGYWMNLAEAAVAANDTELVTEATSKALALRPNDAGLWLQAGRYLTATGQQDAARTAFERVLTLQPDNLEAANELAAIMGVAP